jgi:MarR family transcriptional regulator, organic hydroperoxide resistance regulator
MNYFSLMNKDPVATLLAFEQTVRALQGASFDASWLGLDLTMAQLKAVLLLARSGGLPSRAFGERLHIRPSAVTPLVDRLIAHKLARRESDARDRRVVHVRPTAKAIALQESLLRTSRTVLGRVIDAVPAGERAGVAHALTVLADSAAQVLTRSQKG